MNLREYQRKRDFQRSPEPKPNGKAVARSNGFSYVIQKHAASHLHYDFRLELDGVLKSWAIPKGPSLDPKLRRLAMQVEDHPLEYGQFEGIIPQGEYGGGTVMLWDRGAWEPIGDPHESYRSGKLKFILHGEKLRGKWMLLRTSRPETGKSNEWLLFKERDDEVRSSDHTDIVRDQPLSVLSKRTLEQIATSKDSVWHSNRTSSRKPVTAKPAPAKKARKEQRVQIPPGLKGAKRGTLPQHIEPKLATLASVAPDGDRWLHEIKWDGYRMLCRIDQGRVEFTSRNHNSWTAALKELAKSVGELPVQQAVLDGELVAFRPDGTTDFQALQNAFKRGGPQGLSYCLFDLPYLNGVDLRNVALEERKQLLSQIVPAATDHHPVRYSEHIVGNGPQFFQQASALGLEGVVSKLRESRYTAGRNRDWLKIKSGHQAEFVIGGFTESDARGGFGALLLGYYNTDREFIYVGRVGTGFTDSLLESLSNRFGGLIQKHSPFANLRGRTGEARRARWVQPHLVVKVAFTGVTRDGHIRHSTFLGLLENHRAELIVREHPLSPKPSSLDADSKTATHGSKSKTRISGFVPAAGSKVDGTLAGVRMTNSNRVFFSEGNISKLELAQYYLSIAAWIMPQVANRPLSLVRCPEGLGKECFFQKHPGAGSPTSIRLVPVKEKNTTRNYFVVDKVEDLVSLAQIGALEIHVWGSRADKLELPDRMIFDLDPDPNVPWPRVVESAHQIRNFLNELGLQSFVKTTGGKGLHIVVPLIRRHDWEEVKAFSKAIAELIERADPARYTSNMSKAARVGKIYVDYLRNGRSATAIAAYSTRAHPRATVSVPLRWDELKADVRSDTFTVRNLPHRLSRLKADPWAEMASVQQSLTKAIKRRLGISTGVKR